MSGSATILDTAISCQHVLKVATTVTRLMRKEWAENKLASFNFWCGNAGILGGEATSLDFQLQTNLQSHTILVNLLLMLKLLVQKCIDEGREVKDGETALSGGELARMKDVEDSLTQLSKITGVIRKVGVSSKVQKADRTFDPQTARIRSLRRHLETVLLAHPDEHGCSDSSIQAIDSARLSRIQSRLIDANLRRRHRFNYAQQHFQQLGNGSELTKPTPPETTAVESRPPGTDVENAGSFLESEKSASNQEITTPSTIPAIAANQQSEAYPDPPGWPANDATMSLTDFQINYPNPPSLDEGQITFMCPCCCQRLPVAESQHEKWKKHLIADIQPYTCILEDCTRDGTFYPSKETWLQHMDREHKGSEQWVCHACAQKEICDVTFSDQAGFVAHLESEHGKGIRPRHIPMLVSAWKRKAPLEITSCPLCGFGNEDKSVVLNHTAEHVHLFSLRSLPWAPKQALEGMSDDEEEESYFETHPYFHLDSCQSVRSSRMSEISSVVVTDSGDSLGSEPEDTSSPIHEQHQELIESPLDQLPAAIPNQSGEKNQLDIPDLEEESYNPPAMTRSVHIGQHGVSVELSDGYAPPLERPKDFQRRARSESSPQKEMKDDNKGRVWGYLIPIDTGLVDVIVLKERAKSTWHDQPINELSDKNSTPKSPNNFPPSGYVFGGDPTCDIFFEEPRFPNRHFVLFPKIKNGKVVAMIADLSESGTFVNGLMLGLNNHRELKDGDEVSTGGRTELVLRYPHMQHTGRFRNMYEMGRQLGKGYSAQVHLCEQRLTGDQYAIKGWDVPSGDLTDLLTQAYGQQQEICLLMSVNHPNLIRPKEVFDETDGLYLVMELAPEGDLFSWITEKGPLSESEARHVFRQLLNVLKHLHEHGIIHRNIKPEAVLLVDQQLSVKLGGFCIATMVGKNSFASELAGAPNYTAPEILQDSTQGGYTHAVDIWSLGVVLYICLCGFPPFDDELNTKEHPYTLSDQIKNARFDYPSPEWDSVGDPALNLIDQMLTVDVEKRITLEECLEHPWLSGLSGKKSTKADNTGAWAPRAEDSRTSANFEGRSDLKGKGTLLSSRPKLPEEKTAWEKKGERERERERELSSQRRIT